MATRAGGFASADAALDLISQFDAIGIHRTGTVGDEATTTWLIDRLVEVGVEGQAHAFSLPLLGVGRAVVETPGGVIAGHAQLDAGLTPPDGVAGALVAAGDDRPAAISVLDIDVGATAGRAIEQTIERCVQAGAAGLVVVARRGPASIFLLNAPHIHVPTPLPVLFVAPADAAPVLDALRAGAHVRLVIDGERRQARATNVVARIPADSPLPGAAPVGVMTPKSGWFTCAAERGGGIAIWLAAAEAAARTSNRRRDVILLATSGHELGHAGLEAYLVEHPGLAREAGVWVHLGASIGAAVQPTTTLFASHESLQHDVRTELDQAGAGPYRLAPPGLAPGGEARNIGARGGRFVSLAGGHAFFHTPEDRPEMVDAEAVARFAQAISALIVAACMR